MNEHNTPLISLGAAGITRVIENTLGFLDRRLVMHGERVAYIVSEITSSVKFKNEICDADLFFLCLVHDIGAFRTEEIDKLVEFETGDAHRHALYGYLFLKHLGKIGKDAEAILYHHTPYETLKSDSSKTSLYAQLIFLADRIDVLNGAGNYDDSKLTSYAGTLFSPELINIFIETNAEKNILGRCRDGSFRKYLDSCVTAYLTEETAWKYLATLVYSIDFRSSSTVTHTVVTASISLFLGRKLSLDKQQLSALKYGSFLHDIGKIAVPYEILEKPSSLTDEEMSIMKSHASYTRSIIENAVDPVICEIAARHHEKLDGSGYPLRLTAEKLSVPERIVAVADVMSALLQKRSYKEAFDKEKAIAIIGSMSAKGQLDAKIRKTASEYFDDILAGVQTECAPIISAYRSVLTEYRERTGNNADSL